MSVASTTQSMPDLLFSDSSSELSIMSRSPTPPYPSPPASQQSPRNSPEPDMESSTCTSSAEDDESRPSKRRRISSILPRPTKRLDLDQFGQSPTPDQQAELDRLLKVLRKNRKIVVVAGAGISVSAGIPDFRSSTGLFNSLKAQYNLKGSGKHLFDAAVYRDSSSTSSFHDMVRSLSTLTKSAKPTLFHHLIARIASEDRLLRLYTQNVDGIDTSLEPLATEVPLPKKGPWPKTIQLHGGLEKMTCTKCNHLSDFEADLFEGPVPPACEKCEELDLVRTKDAGKRSHGVGRLRPRMVLYNEHNPDDEAIGAVTKADLRRRPDAIIVVGTTLKIPGVKRIVREMCGIVRNHRDGLAVWINNDPEPSAKEFEDSWDLIVKGTCDEVARHACMRQWDDIETTDFKPVTEEQYRLVKEKGDPVVVLQTPTKPTRFKNIESLPTPVHSPRPITAGSSVATNAIPPTVAEKSASSNIKIVLKQSSVKPKTAKRTSTIRQGMKGVDFKKAQSTRRAPSKSSVSTKSASIKDSFTVGKQSTNTEALKTTKYEFPATEKQIIKDERLSVKQEVTEHNLPNPPSRMSISSICNPPAAGDKSAMTHDLLQTPKKIRLFSNSPQKIRTSGLAQVYDVFRTPERPEVEPLTPFVPSRDPQSPTRPTPSPLTASKSWEPLNDSKSSHNQGPIHFPLRDEILKQKAANKG